MSALLVVTLLPTQAWALPPDDTRDGIDLVALEKNEPVPPDEVKIDELTSWSGAPVEPPAEYIPTDVAPPAQGTDSVALDQAGDELVQAGSLPVSLGKATPTEAEPNPPAPTGSWGVEIKAREATEAVDVDGAIIKVTPPSTGSTPIDVELDYSKFEDLYGTEWSTRLKLIQLPECFLTTPELQECTTPVDVPSANDPAAETVRATIDPAASQVQGLSAQAGGGPVVLAATDSAAGAGGTYKATSLAPSGSWSAGGSAGGFSWTYPLTVASPPAGPAPKIAFNYSSQAVDGKTSVANSQASWIGDGWDYHPGFVERRYRSCSDDRKNTPNNDNATDKKKSDLCWASDNLVMSLGGSSTELVRNDADGKWIPANDDGAKVEYLDKAGNPKAKQTGTYDSEYWRVTTRDGTRYYFGRNDVDGAGTRPVTKSAFTVPVFGNHSGEPCHQAAYADSSCTQAWRWNLDYVEDVHGNAMIIDWEQETNEYAKNGEFKKTVPYVRGGYPKQILYGLRNDNLSGAPAGKVAFTANERCIVEGATSCSLTEFESQNYEDKQPWWDTPSTLHCKPAIENCYVSSPTFWTRVKLAAVTTYGQRTPGTTALSPVDRWDLHQSFPRQRTDTHPPLWLESIRRTGYGIPGTNGVQTDTSLPDVSFIANVDDMPNRVAKSSSDPTPDFDRLRVETIRTETGGEIYVDYSAPCPVGTTHPAPEANTTRCFPSKWSPDPDLENPPLEWFNKYVVDQVVEKDRVARQPDVVTSYTYDTIKGAAWAKNTDEFTKPELRTYDQWRGYYKVTVRRGVTSTAVAETATEQSQTTTRYFRGMSKDAGRPTITVTDSASAETMGEDLPAYQGRAYETVTYSKTGGSTVKRELIWPYARKTASRVRGDGLTALEAYRTDTSRTDSIESISGGKTRTVRSETLERDTNDLPLQTHTSTLTPNSAGGMTTGDESCTMTSYVHKNTTNVNDPYLIGLPHRVRTTIGDCSAAAAAAGNQIVSDARTSYDALNAFGTAPVKGLVRQVDTTNGDGDGWITTIRTEYDDLGRATKTINAKGDATATSFSPTSGVAFQATTTNALNHAATSAIDPGRGTVLSVTDPNGRKTSSSYDDLGRIINVWSPTRNPATDKASIHFTYQIDADKVPAVTTQTLRDNGTYEDSVTIYDGQLRPRQTQTEAMGGGRIITDTLYNANGTVGESKNGYFAKDEPKPEIFVPETVFEVPNSTKVAYDGLGRAVRTTALHQDVAQHTTTSAYAGDWTLTRTGMSADGTSPLKGSRSAKTWSDALGRTSKIQHYTTTSLIGPDPAAVDTLYSYDPRGKLAKVIDANGNAWTYTYDVRGRLTASADPDMGPSSFGYNDLDQQTWSKDGRERAQHTVYDALGRPTELRDDSTTGPLVTKWTYDTLPGAKGYPVASTRYTEGTAFTGEITGYDTEYRPTGSKITIPDITDTTSKIFGITKGLAGTYAYTTTYTETGKPQSVTLPATPGGLAAEKVITRYNGEGAPITTSGLAWYTAGTIYSPFGEVLRTTSGEGSKRLWNTAAYDEFTGRLTKTVAQRETTSPIWKSTTGYSYDTVGNVTSITGTQAETTGTQTTTKVDQQCFAYDPMGRLVKAWTGITGCPTTPPADAGEVPGPNLSQVSPGTDGSGYWQTYGFDAIGNRTKLTVQDPAGIKPTEEYAYSYGRQDTNNGTQATTSAQPHTLTDIQSKQNVEGTTFNLRQSYLYDPSGNTTERITAGGETSKYTWDRRNKLTSVDTDNNGTANATYLYDATGNRLIEDNGSTRTLYLGEAEITVNTTGQALDAQRYYTHPGAPTTTRTTAGKTTGHKLTVLLTDHHNTSTTAVEQTNNQAITRRFFDPYGNPRGTKPTNWPGRHTFLGTGIDDPTTGLTHIGAREYDATTGRFLSADPLIDITDPLQMNGYTYANANPVSLSDPTGLAPDDCTNRGVSCSKNTDGSWNVDKNNNWNKYNPSGPDKDNPTPDDNFKQQVSIVSEAINATASHYLSKDEYAAWNRAYQKELDRVRSARGEVTSDDLIAAAGQVCFGPGAFNCPKPMKNVFIDLEWLRMSQYGGSDDRGGVAPMASSAQALRAGLGKVGGLKQTSFCNSFTAGTEVLMADGTSKPIEDIQNGDTVLATDTETGDTQAKTVTAEITGTGTKNLVKVTIDTDGEEGRSTAALTATDGHPFWVSELGKWIDATKLKPGQRLETTKGTQVLITAIDRWTQPDTVHNLTVADIHTYYVLAGDTPVLVHNANCPTAINLGPRPAGVGDDWVGRRADNGKGTVWQRPGSTGNADMVRVMDPTGMYPNGYVRFHNKSGQPIGLNGKPGSKADTHIPMNPDGTYPVPVGW
ncbi:polymorphic toxin-type HINT domain-containing protein [Streptomyces sp. NPDC059442]|uniref:polymorphic toxin-type HINT domain-containing protein n=1 Tax=Streptomyces sp. NPDC059442 TaxID=3346830 RepID=UPI0036B43AD2